MNDEIDKSYDTITSLVDGFFAILPKLVIAAIVFALMLIAAGAIRYFVRRLVTSRAGEGVGIAIGRIAYIAMFFAGFLMSVAVVAPSVGAAELLQILGVGSVAIGFAFRDILQNFLAGLLILLREPFTRGDWIKFGDFEGMVTEISTRSTWLKTFDGQDVTIPNGQIFTNPVQVYSKEPLVRTQYDFGVSYDTDIDQAVKVIEEAARSVEGVVQDKPVDVGLVDLAGSSVNLRARWWAQTDTVYQVKLAVMRAVKIALDRAEIDIPYPHKRILLDDRIYDALESTGADKSG